MQKKKKKKKKKKKETKQTNKMKAWNLESWLALCPTSYIFNNLYYSFFPHQLTHSLFIFNFFFSLLFSHPHTSSQIPQFPLFSILNFLSSLSFYVVFLFVLLFCFVCIFFNLMAVKSNASSHLTFLHFSLKFLTVAFLFCFIFLCKVHLFISFLFSSFLFFYFFLIFGWDFSFTVQTPCQLNLEFQPVFIEGFLIERVRRGFLV